MSGIGLLNEKPLHASLKEWYAQPKDQFEVPVDGFVIDIVRDDLHIIEAKDLDEAEKMAHQNPYISSVRVYEIRTQVATREASVGKSQG